MSETNNTAPAAEETPVAVYHGTPTENTAIGDPASTPASTQTIPESGTQEEVRVQLKELAKHFSCVSTKQTEEGVELYLFTQTRVAHPTFVETIRQKIANKEDVGKNYILTGTTIEEILENLATNGL